MENYKNLEKELGNIIQYPIQYLSSPNNCLNEYLPKEITFIPSFTLINEKANFIILFYKNSSKNYFLLVYSKTFRSNLIICKTFKAKVILPVL